jgi:hypothetical protein
MRRAGLGPRQGSAGISTPASSSVPSKATSEAGLETTSEEGLLLPVDGTPSKDKSKLTREEREAQYKAARERIFGDFQESVTSETSTGENSASMSRSSSSSGRKRSRKHKTPKDDSFEARSAYYPSYAPMNIPPMQPQYQQPFGSQPYELPAYQGQAMYNNGMNYGTTPTQAYPGFDQSMQYNTAPMGYGPVNGQHFSPSESWSSLQTSTSTAYFAYPETQNAYSGNSSPMINQMNGQYMHQNQSGVQQPQPWMNNQGQAPYQTSQGPPSSNANAWTSYQPGQAMNNNHSHYGYSQMPDQNYPTNAGQFYNAAYPGQNNPSRSLFNPQTRSFVPNNTTSRNGGRRKKPSPASSQHQSRNNSTSAAPRSFGTDNPDSSTRSFNQQSFGTMSKPALGRDESLQQRYGAPAHLPKKPPAPQGSTPHDIDGTSKSIAVTSITAAQDTVPDPASHRETETAPVA